MMKRIFITLALVGIGLISIAYPVNAQAPNNSESGQALEIAPPVISLFADPGETINTKINLGNISNSELIVVSQVNDFVAAGEDGTPKVLTEDGQEKSVYSIIEWVEPLDNLLLTNKEKKDLPVVINVPANASPGGYYGVVRFTATPPELKDTGVSLSASLGALIFIRVNGAVNEQLSLEEFAVKKDNKPITLLESTPIEFSVRVKNTGNIYEQPTGQISITDMFGNKVATVNVNLEQRIVLPDSIREYTATLDSGVIGNKQLFGSYKAELKLIYGEDKQTITSETSFWIIPYRLIAAIAIAFVVGFFVLRQTIRKYNRHIIKKATKSKK